MPKPRVYVETTIPSFYHDPRTTPGVVKMRRWTRLWWRGAPDRCELVTSDVVLQELAAGTHEMARSRMALAAPLLRLEAGPAVGAVVDEYLKHKLMPAVPPFDAWHLALASTHKCDFIVDVELQASGESQQGASRGAHQRVAGIVRAEARNSAGPALEGTMIDWDCGFEWTEEIDATIEEIREIRRKMWAEFDNDPHKFSASMMEKHAESVRQGHPEIKLPEGEAARISAACEAMRRKREAHQR
ncbi:MAG TPA: hypothetical protein VF632_11605 [Longimicrobium sp.]